MRNWRITWSCIAICGFVWLVFPAKAQQPQWSDAKLTGSYGGNQIWNQKVTFALHRQGNELVGTYLAQSETGPGKLIGKIGLDGSIELREVENGNVYGTFTLRKSSAGSYEGEWHEVGKSEAYQLQLAPLAVAELPSISNRAPQTKVESAVKQEALRTKESMGANNIKPQKPEKSTSLLSSPPVSSAPRNTRSLISPIGSRRYSVDGFVSSSDRATPSASFEPGPRSPVVNDEAKRANRFMQSLHIPLRPVQTILIIVVLGLAILWILANDVIYGKPLTLTVRELIAFLNVSIRGFVAAISERLRRVLASSRSTFFSKSASWTDDSHFELLFGRFLENCNDILSFAKNTEADFRLNYVNADGHIANYYPDFIVKVSAKEIYIVESKGLEDLDVPLRMERLRQWCEYINRVQSKVKLNFVYVDVKSFEKYKPISFRQLVDNFVEYKVRQSPTSPSSQQPNDQASPSLATTPLPQQS